MHVDVYNYIAIDVVTSDSVWYNPPLQCYPSLCCGVPFRRMVLLRKWSNILLFYSLVFNCIILFCVFVFMFVLCFYCYYCNWSFWKSHRKRLHLAMSFYSLSPTNTLCVPYWKNVETTCKRRFCIFLTWTLLEITSSLMPLENFVALLLHKKLIYYCY